MDLEDPGLADRYRSQQRKLREMEQRIEARQRLRGPITCGLVLAMLGSLLLPPLVSSLYSSLWGGTVAVATIVLGVAIMLSLESWVKALHRCPECQTSLRKVREPSCPHCGLPLKD